MAMKIKRIATNCISCSYFSTISLKVPIIKPISSKLRIEFTRTKRKEIDLEGSRETVRGDIRASCNSAIERARKLLVAVVERETGLIHLHNL